MLDDPQVSDAVEALLNDPVFHRLRDIREVVASGRASPDTVARWQTLRQAVATILDYLNASIVDIPPQEQDKVVQQGIQASTQQDLSVTTLH